MTEVREDVGFPASYAFPLKYQEASFFLGLSMSDVFRLASLCHGADKPDVVHTYLEELAAIINMVATHFRGNTQRTAAWFKARNPILGDVSPRDMIRKGRHVRLRGFVIEAVGATTSVR
jgi:hypothetical protein